MSSTAPCPPPALPGRRRLPLGLLILIALLFAIALARANRHTALPALGGDRVLRSRPRESASSWPAQARAASPPRGRPPTAAPIRHARRCSPTGAARETRPSPRSRPTAAVTSSRYGPGLIVSHDDAATWAPARAFGERARGPGGRHLGVDGGARLRRSGRRGPLLPRARARIRRRRAALGADALAARRARARAVEAPAFGQTWLLRTSRSSAYVLSSAAVGAARATLSFTADGGSTWSRRPPPCGTRALSSVLAAAPDGTLIAVCAGEPSAGFQAKSLATRATAGGAGPSVGRATPTPRRRPARAVPSRRATSARRSPPPHRRCTSSATAAAC